MPSLALGILLSDYPITDFLLRLALTFELCINQFSRASVSWIRIYSQRMPIGAAKVEKKLLIYK